MKTTTNMMTCVKGLAGVASIALALPLAAIENPADENAPKEKGNKGAVAEEAPKENQKGVKKLAMFGIGGARTSETLSLHLGLEGGNGLTIFHVVLGSSAAKAGLKPHDVLTEFDGKKIGSQQDLRDALAVRQPGDEVTLKYIHKGKAEEKKVVLGERIDMPQMIPGWRNPWLQGMGDIPEADRQRMQDQMKKHIEEMRKQLEKNGGRELDLQRLLDGADPEQGDPKPKAGNKFKKFNFNTSATITMMDGHGSVTMKTINGKREVIVKDKAGKIQFEGPYETAQDKAAVPDDVRDRLERLNLGENGKSGFRLQILPGGMVPPPEELDEDEAAE